MIGLSRASGETQRIARVTHSINGKVGSGVSYTYDTITRKVITVTITATARPLTVTFYNEQDSAIRTITQPAGTEDIIDVSADNIPMFTNSISRPNGLPNKVVLGPRIAVHF